MKAHALLLLVAFALFARRAYGQERAMESVKKAEQLQQAGRLDEGRQLLEQEIPRCDPRAAGRECRVLLLSTLGYLYQRQARTEPKQQERLLGRAIRYYDRSLRENPQDGAVLRNLALTYRALGRDGDLEPLLTMAIGRDRDSAAFYALLLGDVYERRSDWARAADAYRQAIAAAPDREVPRRRLVGVYEQLPPDSVLNLYRRVSEPPGWDARFAGVTARVCELVITKLDRRDLETTKRAFVRWIVLLAETQQLSVERLDVLTKTWLASPIADLRIFVTDPSRPPREGSWREPDAREAVGRVALSLGRRWAAASNLQSAEAYWQNGLEVAQQYPDVPASLDVARELAVLYQRFADFDPNGVKFRQLEGRLFEQKSHAYERADRQAIQQLHTILGLIYAERRVWRSDVPWTNAVYQLEHALSTARDQDAARRTYQPLPQLRALLAEGYATTGDTQRALATYVDATQAYLDVDDVSGAGRMLERGRSLALSDRRLDALQELVAARDRQVAIDSSSQRLAGDACDENSQRATRAARGAGIDTVFLKRQRFKLLADCILGGPARVRPADAARVFRVATEQDVQLAGAGDLVRLERSQSEFGRVVRVSPSPSRGDVATLRVQLSAQSRPTYVAVSGDALVGVTVLERLGAETDVRSVRVHRGSVTVETGEMSAVDRERIRTTTQSVRGVESATVREAPVVSRPEAPLAPPVPPPAIVPPFLKPSLPPAPPPPFPTPTTSPEQRNVPAAADLAASVPSRLPRAPLDPNTAIDSAVARYARALESRNVDAVRRVVPKFDAGRLEALFRRADSLQARLRLSVDSAVVDGERTMAVITVLLEYRERGVLRREPLKQRAVFTRAINGSWQMVSVR